MADNLLNNENKTNYLFKKENFKAQTRLDGFSNTLQSINYPLEPYQGKSIVLQESIFSEDISKNINSSVFVTNLFLDSNVLASTWNGTVSQQIIKDKDLSDNYPSLDYYKFFKRVYLEPVEPDNPCFWWIREDQNLDPSPDNNLLSKMVPGGLSGNNSMFNPIVEFWDKTLQAWISNEKAGIFQSPSVGNSVNWTIDYATGILTLNVSETHLSSINYNLDASNSKSNVEKCRPRISFIRYVGPLGGGSGGSSGGNNSGGSGGTGTGNGISDASANAIIDNYLFEVPKKVIGISHEEVITSAGSEIQITWNNPNQRCAAFDFYQMSEDPVSAEDLYQTYYVNSTGISNTTNNINIWKTIKRSLNKLPFHERLRVQYKAYNPNDNFSTPGWKDFPGAQIKGTLANSTNDSNRILYPIFKDITKISISSIQNATNPASGQLHSNIQSFHTQDIVPVSGAVPNDPLCYKSENYLDNTKVYHFRVALDNRACIGDPKKEFWESDRDISNNLNWATVPLDQNTFIELGSYGPAPPPSAIRVVVGENVFEPSSASTEYAGTIVGFAGPSPNPVMDVSFNTKFPGPTNLSVQYGFDMSGGKKQNSKQLDSNNQYIEFHYANENSFGFADLSYNTPMINADNFSVDCYSTFNTGQWNPSNNFSSKYPNGWALPEYTYDISNVYMKNNKVDEKAFANNTVRQNLPDDSSYASPQETSTAIFLANDYMEYLNNEDISSNGINPEYKITLTSAPSNYYGDKAKLKAVRGNDSSTKILYAIFLKSGATLDINYKDTTRTYTDSQISNFITCTQTKLTAGTDIVGNNIAQYELKFTYYKNSVSNLPLLQSISIDGYDKGTGNWPRIYNSSGTGNNLTINLSVQNEDATQSTVSGPKTRNQEQFGGYYNIQKVLNDPISQNKTGLQGISILNVDDASSQTGATTGPKLPGNRYAPYSLELKQKIPISPYSSSNPGQRTKTIHFLLAHAPTVDVSITKSNAEPDLTTTCALFGALMPDNKISFGINGFEVDDINYNWMWPTGNLCDLTLRYHNNTTGTILDTEEEDWDWTNNRSTQTPTWNFGETLNTNSIILTNDSNKYSRNGKENNSSNISDAQFSVKIVTKNNIYSTASPSVQEFESAYYSNGGSTEWDWTANNFHNNNRTLWWDYTYKENSISNGDLPIGFITVTGDKPGSNSISVTLQLQKKSILRTSGAFTTYWLGGSTPGVNNSLQTTNHEWYDTDYPHNSIDISDNQILWADGAFRCGGATGTYTKDTNILNPYIDYDSNYYAIGNTVAPLLPRHDLKFDKGEDWNYEIAAGQYYDPLLTSKQTINGKYKWLLKRLSWSANQGTYTAGQNPWNTTSSIEVYVSQDKNTPSFSNKLTLGEDYIIYFCVVGDGLNNVTSRVEFGPNSNNSKYRSGWLDGQRKYTNFNNVNDGRGCFDYGKSQDAAGLIEKYIFTLPTLNFNSTSAENYVTDIFIRIGIKNNSAQLSSGSSYYNKRKITNVSVKLNV